MTNEYKSIWDRVMKDLVHATYCHQCGEHSTGNNYCGEFCWKSCWKESNYDFQCFFGGEEDGCLFCTEQNYRPSLKNSYRMRSYYGLNPMGSGKKFGGQFTEVWIVK